MVPEPADADTGEGRGAEQMLDAIKLTHLLPMGTPSIPPNGPRAASTSTHNSCRLTQPRISALLRFLFHGEGIGGVWGGVVGGSRGGLCLPKCARGGLGSMRAPPLLWHLHLLPKPGSHPDSLTTSLDSKEMSHHSSWHKQCWGEGPCLAVENCTAWVLSRFKHGE